MFDFFENNEKDDFFDNCDIEMEEMDSLYIECEKLHNENLNIEQQKKDMYTVYIMFSVVSYMLIIGSNINNYLKKYYIKKFFKNSIETNAIRDNYLNTQYDVNTLD